MTVESVATKPLAGLNVAQPSGWRRVTWFVINIRRHSGEIWCGFGLGLLSVLSWLAIPLTPVWDASHPVFLLMMSCKTTIVEACAMHQSWSIIAPLVTARLMVADPFWYYLGYKNIETLGGEREQPTGWRIVVWALGWPFRAYAKLMKRFEKVLKKLGLLGVLIRPNGPIMYSAGLNRLRVRDVAIADLVGTIAQVIVLWRLEWFASTAGQMSASAFQWLV